MEFSQGTSGTELPVAGQDTTQRQFPLKAPLNFVLAVLLSFLKTHPFLNDKRKKQSNKNHTTFTVEATDADTYMCEVLLVGQLPK